MNNRRPQIERVLSQAFSDAQPGEDRVAIMGAVADYCNDYGAIFDICGTSDPRTYRHYISFDDAEITDCERVMCDTIDEVESNHA
jgi:hypothetical protein